MSGTGNSAAASDHGCHRTKLSPSLTWKSLVLVATGLLGGIFTGISGSGIDICSFAVLTLLFRVSEKVAMPTSVVLMAINTAFGFAYVQGVMGGVAHDSWGFWLVCVPVVVIGAPVGSLIGERRDAEVFANYPIPLSALRLIMIITIINWVLFLFLFLLFILPREVFLFLVFLFLLLHNNNNKNNSNNKNNITINTNTNYNGNDSNYNG